jgi:hypothetical protein
MFLSLDTYSCPHQVQAAIDLVVCILEIQGPESANHILIRELGHYNREKMPAQENKRGMIFQKAALTAIFIFVNTNDCRWLPKNTINKDKCPYSRDINQDFNCHPRQYNSTCNIVNKL